MTRNENERLAILETQSENMSLDITEIKADMKKLLANMPALVERVNKHDDDLKSLCKEHAKLWDRLNSNLVIAITAVLGSIGAIAVIIIKGAI